MSRSLRKGKEVEFKVAIGRLEDGEKLVAAAETAARLPMRLPTATLLGMTVSSLTDELRSTFKTDEKVKGAIVTEVATDGVAAEKGIEAGRRDP